MKLEKILPVLLLLILTGLALTVSKAMIGDWIWDTKLKDTYTVYTRVVDEGIRKSPSQENADSDYRYQCNGITEKGEKIRLDFYGTDGEAIRQGTYLKIAYDDTRGVVSWDAISEKEIPEDLIQKIGE